MPRDYRLYLDDILESVQKIERYLNDVTFAEFSEDSMRADAVVRNLEIIGEAVKNLPREIRAKYPTVDWAKIAGFRDIAAHQYFGIKLDVVWSIFQTDLSPLETQITSILEQENDGDPA